MATFQFELVTPERLLFSGAVEGVVIPGTEGDFEVLAMHAPVMSTIRPGLIAVRETTSGAPKRIFVRGGFAEVGPAGLTILAEQAIAYEDLSAEKLSAEIKMAEEDKLVVSRARKMQRFLSQPFHVAEVFTGTPGVFVKLEDTIKAFKGILAGDYDDLPEAAFYMVGTIDEAVAKAKKHAAEA